MIKELITTTKNDLITIANSIIDMLTVEFNLILIDMLLITIAFKCAIDIVNMIR